MAEQGGRYQRTTSGLVGALVVTVLLVIGWVAFRAITSDKEPTPVRTVDWAGVVEATRADAALPVLAPTTLPDGWRATSAEGDGSLGTLHLGMLTGDGRYVGLEEALATPLADLVDQYVDADASPGDDIELAGRTWRSWTDAGGDYAVGFETTTAKGAPAAYLVVGTAEPEDIRAFAASLG